MHEELANTTLQIVCGESSGSGFHFRRKDIVVTNHHVIQQNVIDGTPVTAVTENGDDFSLELLTYSNLKENDFAVLRATTAMPSGRHVLIPKVMAKIERGTKVMFSGFPHGVSDLL